MKVVELQGFTEVSEVMGQTQSGVSRPIKALEEEIGLQLLSRTHTPVKPTATGELFYRKAKQLLEQWDHLQPSPQKRMDRTVENRSQHDPRQLHAAEDRENVPRNYPKIEFSIHTEDSEDVLMMCKNVISIWHSSDIKSNMKNCVAIS